MVGDWGSWLRGKLMSSKSPYLALTGLVEEWVALCRGDSRGSFHI